MKKHIAQILLVMFLFALPAISSAYTINDPVNNSFDWSSSPNNFDRVGASIYEAYGMNVSAVGNNLIFDIFTNFPQTGEQVGSWKTLPGDLGIDLNRDGVYEYGLALTTHDSVPYLEVHQILWLAHFIAQLPGT